MLNAPSAFDPNYRSTISIAELLDFVNTIFSDILPESVLRHYGYVERPSGILGENALYSDRDSEGNTLSEGQRNYFKDSNADTERPILTGFFSRFMV